MKIDIPLVIASWQTIYTTLGLGQAVRDEAHYIELLAFVDKCFERFGCDDAHPIFALVDLVAPRIKEYEDRQHPWPDTSTQAKIMVTNVLPYGDGLAS